MASTEKHVYKFIDSPIGKLKLVASGKGLAAILWEKDNPARVRIRAATRDDNHPVLLETEEQLNNYFAGKRKVFTVPLAFIGTEFQKSVWRALLDVPFGQTVSYAEIAKRIGSPRAVRAVGAANGKNPIAIIGPCHRIIGSNGKLTGYAGGLWAKEFLLKLESATPRPALPTVTAPPRRAKFNRPEQRGLAH